MRFLLIPAVDKPYDLRMMIRLGQAICAEGHQAAMMLLEYRNPAHVNGFDGVIEVNRPRPEFLNKRSLHISWVQDLKPEETELYGTNQGPNDLIYTMGDSEWMGLRYCGPYLAGSMLTGVLPEWLERPLTEDHDIDFGICAFMTWPIPKWDTPETEVFRLCADEIIKIFQPLHGNYRINEGFRTTARMFDRWNARKYREFIDDPANAGIRMRPLIEVREHLWNKFALIGGEITKDVARFLDRQLLARLALSVSKNLRLRGFNWELHDEFKPYWMPNTNNEDEMFEDFCRCKINLHNNFSGLGLHARVLECIAVGGFIGTHTTAEPEKAGRLRNDFEADRHFFEFTPENFTEKAPEWLNDKERRMQGIRESRKIIAAKHLWKHRAQQLLRDLDLRKPVYDAPTLKVVNF